MEVTCERCNTRYEFDDALVSERGTTVKCSSCDHQFRVKRANTSGVSRWVVRRKDGTEVIFDAMRELQAAILSGDVEPTDVLAADNQPERPLGKIPELETFFSRSSRRQTSTQPGMGETAKKSGGITLPPRTGNTLRPPGEVFATPPPPASANTRRQYASTPPPPLPGSIPPPAADDDEPTPRHQRKHDGPDLTPLAGTPVDSDRLAMLAPGRTKPTASDSSTRNFSDSEPTEVAFDDDEPTCVRAPEDSDEEIQDVDEEAEVGPISSSPPPNSASLPPVTAVHDDLSEDTFDAPDGMYTLDEPEISSLPVLTPSPSVVRPSVLRRSYTGPRFTTIGPPTRRPGFGRWVASLIILGSLIVAGFIWLKRQPDATSTTEVPKPATSSDPRVEQLLSEAKRQLMNGNLDGAQEHYVKASAIASEPRIVAGLAQIALIRADETWLHLRLLPEKAPAARELLTSQLQQRLAKAKTTMKAVAPLAKDDKSRASSEIILHIDYLRLQDKAADARKRAALLENKGADAGRALASLDLMEERYDPQSVAARLREAVRSEQKLGRAQALLVYALARSGDKETAKSDLERFATAHPTHPLLSALKNYVAAAKEAKPDADPLGAAEPGSSADPNAIPPDFREALRRASLARQRGDFGRARTLYQAALEKSPGNSEALTGLAQVAQAQGDSSTSAQLYRKLLRQNPGYLPALVALADIQWASGARGEALSLYQQVVQSAAGSSYGRHAQSRIDQAQSSATPSSSSTATPAPPATTATPTATATATATATPTAVATAKPAAPSAPPPTSAPSSHGNVDLSDLPEFQ